MTAVDGFIYPNELELQWSVLIVLYPFITGLVAGAFILASLERVFNVQAVKPTYRLALLTALARIARRKGCGRFEWAVLDWNTPAIRFYRRLGARLRKGSWPVPPIFRVIERGGAVTEAEMLRTFNMGIGMVLVVRASDAAAAAGRLRRRGVDAYLIGEIRKSRGRRPQVRMVGGRP